MLLYALPYILTQLLFSVTNGNYDVEKHENIARKHGRVPRGKAAGDHCLQATVRMREKCSVLSISNIVISVYVRFN